MRKICLLIVFFCAFAAWADDYVVLSPSFVPQALLARQIARFYRKFDRLQKMGAFQKLKNQSCYYGKCKIGVNQSLIEDFLELPLAVSGSRKTAICSGRWTSSQ